MNLSLSLFYSDINRFSSNKLYYCPHDKALFGQLFEIWKYQDHPYIILKYCNIVQISPFY